MLVRPLLPVPVLLASLLYYDSCVDSVCEETGDWPLDIDDLLRFSFQVAQGLDFLAARNVSEEVSCDTFKLSLC